MMSLVQQDFERRKVGVPLNQCGHWTEASERRGIERPDRLYDPGAVVVDQNVHVLGDVMAGKVDLADRLDQQSSAERPLCLIDVIAKETKALLGVGQRQQVVEISSADRAPRKVLGNEHRLD